MASQDEGRFNRSLAEENLQLRQEISNLHVQLELQSQTTDRDITGERDRLRRRALELTQREQSILQKEQEVDQWHEEAAQLRREAEEKAHEVERLLFSKQKYIDELEESQKRVKSREMELDDVQRVKEEAIDQRREQVRLLEEALAKHNEEVEAKLQEIEEREKALSEHEETLERSMAEREARLSEHQEEIEEALSKLKDTQQLYAKMDGFVKEKRQHLLSKETELKRKEQQLDLREKQLNDITGKLASEHSERLDAESQVASLQKKLDDLEHRLNDLQTLLAEARNENVRLSQEYMRYKDIGDTADRRVSLFSKTNEELQQKIESQNIFILQLQKKIAELQESNYYITNDHSRATLALNEVSGQVSRLLAVVNAKSPQKAVPKSPQDSEQDLHQNLQQDSQQPPNVTVDRFYHL